MVAKIFTPEVVKDPCTQAQAQTPSSKLLRTSCPQPRSFGG